MEIKINKDVCEYSENIFLGLNLRQSIFSIFACAIACGIFMALKDKLGTEVTSWICVCGALPFAIIGFVKFQGLFLEDLIKIIVNSWILQKRKFTVRETLRLRRRLRKKYVKKYGR